MKLYDLEEPQEENNGLAVGIDLGTTNSLVAFKNRDKIEVFSDPTTGSRLLSSIVSYDNGLLAVGKDAISPKYSISSIKRLMGKSKKDIYELKNIDHFNFGDKTNEQMLYIKLGELELTPAEISAEILKKLIFIAERRLGKPVTRAVITVPAYFDDTARNETKLAAEMAGIEVLRLINEPTAAAVAYHLDSQPSGTFLIYDLGGGTFDVSILKMQKGILQVIATSGDRALGGDDFDYTLMRFICQKHEISLPKQNLVEALRETRSIKQILSSKSEWNGYVKFIKQDCSISREEFNNAIKDLTLKTIKLVKKVLKDANLISGNVDEIVLVGGATKVPLIAELLEKIFNKKPLSKINPEEVVAIGAAIQANALTEGSDNLLLDVTPLSLGIELLGGIVEVIIPKNAPIPTLISKTYSTYQDNQTGIKIHVVQGESHQVEKCKSLGKLEISGLPKLPAGEAKVVISFRLDADGILTVTAEEKLTGKSNELLIKPYYKES